MLAVLFSQAQADWKTTLGAGEVRPCANTESIIGAGCPDKHKCPPTQKHNESTCFYRKASGVDNCNTATCFNWYAGLNEKVTVEYADECAKGNFVPPPSGCGHVSRCLNTKMPMIVCPANHCLRRTSCCIWECQDPNAMAAESEACPTEADWCTPKVDETCPANGCPGCLDTLGQTVCTPTNVHKCDFQTFKTTGGNTHTSRRRSGSHKIDYKCPQTPDNEWCYAVNPVNHAEWQCKRSLAEGETKQCASQPRIVGCPVCGAMDLPYGEAKCNSIDHCLLRTGCCKWECKSIHTHEMCPHSLQPKIHSENDESCLPRKEGEGEEENEEEEEDEDDELECGVEQCISHSGCGGKQKCIKNTAAWELHENVKCKQFTADGHALHIGKTKLGANYAHAACIVHNKNNPAHVCTGVYDVSCDGNWPGQYWELCTIDYRPSSAATGKMNLMYDTTFTPGRGHMGCVYRVKNQAYVKTTVSDEANLRRRIHRIMDRLDRKEL